MRLSEIQTDSLHALRKLLERPQSEASREALTSLIAILEGASIENNFDVREIRALNQRFAPLANWKGADVDSATLPPALHNK